MRPSVFETFAFLFIIILKRKIKGNRYRVGDLKNNLDSNKIL